MWVILGDCCVVTKHFCSDCVVFPQSISVSGTQIRPRRWWNVPADHRVGHAEGAWQWRPDQQLQFAGFHHWWQQGSGAMRCAASCHPSVERESNWRPSLLFIGLFKLKHVFLVLRPQVGSHADITEDSVSLFHMVEPRIGKATKQQQKQTQYCPMCMSFMWIKMRHVWLWFSWRDPRARHRRTSGADRPVSARAAQEERHRCGGARHGKMQTLLPHD